MTPPEQPFEEPWQAQAFALTVQLHRRGAFTWSEWARALASEIAERPVQDGAGAYYEAWVAALESLAAGKGLADESELAGRVAAWSRAYLATPHGQPVELANASRPGLDLAGNGVPKSCRETGGSHE